jgi:hypothetical protein
MNIPVDDYEWADGLAHLAAQASMQGRTALFDLLAHLATAVEGGMTAELLAATRGPALPVLAEARRKADGHEGRIR